MVARTTYKKYMASTAWRARRSLYFETHDKQCLACKATNNIHLHHRSYKNFGNEKDADLRPLCKKCHARVHTFEKRGWRLTVATDHIINGPMKRFAPRPKRKLRAKLK